MGFFKKKYVLGFCFNLDYTEVALIKKTKPDWQKGKYNGIGGKVEFLENRVLAMWREFYEETGYNANNWFEYAILNGVDYKVYCYFGAGDLSKLKTTTDEEVRIFKLSEIKNNPLLLKNMDWLIELARDTGKNFKGPVYAKIYYKS